VVIELKCLKAFVKTIKTFVAEGAADAVLAEEGVAASHSIGCKTKLGDSTLKG
jgi:hypothetical protein